jgi:hypothetical protein
LVCAVTLTSGKTEDTLIISGLSKLFEIPCIVLARFARCFNRLARHVTTDGSRFSEPKMIDPLACSEEQVWPSSH